jgi:hypothetical protein
VLQDPFHESVGMVTVRHWLSDVLVGVYIFLNALVSWGSWLHPAISGMPVDLAGSIVRTVTRKLVSVVPISTCCVLRG